MRRRTMFVLLAVVPAVVVMTTAISGCGSKKKHVRSELSSPRCTVSQLRGHAIPGGAAAGTVFFSVALSNTGAPCWLAGYPSLRIKGAHGLLPTHVIHGGADLLNGAPKRVRVANIRRASVLVSYEDVPVGKERTCPVGEAILLRPPGTKAWLTIKFGTGACGHVTLHTSPVLAGVHSSR